MACGVSLPATSPDAPSSSAEAVPEAGRDPGTGLLADADADAAIAAAPPSSALAALAEVEVKGRAPRTGYDRDLFGEAGWTSTATAATPATTSSPAT